MTTTMTITLLIIAAASIALNVFQFMERKMERKETNRLVADAALLERDHEKLVKTYLNEKLHREWAVGRIQDQQAVINKLTSINKPKRQLRQTK